MASRLFKFIYWKIIDVAYRFNFLSYCDIPIIINNFNRLTYPKQLLAFLEKCGFTNIILFDNKSTYEPLLDFYRTTQHKVIRSTVNYGHLAFWKSGIYHKYKWNYFVYTDSDVVPVRECPLNFMRHFMAILQSNYHIDKVGFGIKIDDLPDSFLPKAKVVEYEKQYWANEVSAGVFDAPIDTTFAVYRPFSNLKFGEVYTLKAVRLGFPYLIHHLPWYVDSGNLSFEDRFYIQTCNASSSMGQHQKGKKDIYL